MFYDRVREWSQVWTAVPERSEDKELFGLDAMTRYTLLQAESKFAFLAFQWRTDRVQGHNALAGYAVRQGNALRVLRQIISNFVGWILLYKYIYNFSTFLSFIRLGGAEIRIKPWYFDFKKDIFVPKKGVFILKKHHFALVIIFMIVDKLYSSVKVWFPLIDCLII